MSISFVGGKPGAGKTLYAVGLIIRELLTTDRLVVTNVPLKVERLNEYLQERNPSLSVPLVGPESRLRLLDHDDTARDLYEKYSRLYHGAADPDTRERLYDLYETEIRTKNVTEETRRFWEYRSNENRRFDKDTGAFIVLDELHIHFNARKWMHTGEECLHYLSQHRKLGDDVVCITQALGNVDKQFRSVAEDFTVIINESKRRLGPFKGRNRFVRASYYKEPGGPNDQPFEKVPFTLDASGVASCYDTAAGVGVHGNKADTGKKPKGIPIMVALPAAIVFVALVVGITPFLLGKAAGSVMTPETEDTGKPHRPASSPARLPRNASTEPREPAYKDPLPIGAMPEVRAAKNPLYVAGITVLNRPGQLGRFTLQLSDGRSITEADGIVQSVGRNRVTLTNGTELWIGNPLKRNQRLAATASPVELVEVEGSAPPQEPIR